MKAPAEAVGVIGLDVPVELITAAGLMPVPVVCEVGSTGAEAFAEGAGSPLLRSLVEALTEGPYRSLRRLAISSTPSSYASLYALLRELRRGGEALIDTDTHLFDLNRGMAPSMAGLRRQAMAQFQTVLEGWSGQPISGTALADAIEAANARRRVLQAFQTARVAGEPRISGADALAVFAGASTPDLSSRPTLSGRRTVYSGSETVTPDLYRQIESGGLVIVADDQDAGSRAIGPEVATGGDPLTALAERYFHRDPSPARFTVAERTAYLLALATRARAEHVVFRFAAYDHPPAWDYPSQRAALTAAGITSELIEVPHG